MRTYPLLILLCSITFAQHAQSAEPRSLAAEALHIAISLPETEMRDCAKAHPQQAQRFTDSAKQSRTKLEAALEGLRATRAQELDTTVPEILIVGREMTAALMATDASRLTLSFCNRAADEIARVTDQEANDLMNQLVTTLVNGVAAHRQGMNRALR